VRAITKKRTNEGINTMADMYNDIFLRSNLASVGLTPQTGAWTQSPDIIPNGTEVLGDPVTSLTASYGSDVGRPTVMNQQNYFYIRGKNLFAGASTGTFELYYCPQNLFLFPELWVDNQLKTSSGATQVTASVAAQNDIVVPQTAFTNLPISDVHHCLIGRVITSAHPNPLPEAGSISDMNALAAFILDHPGFCWRNVVLVDRSLPTFTHQFNLDTGATGGKVLMGISCKDITPGSSVAFSCGDPIPSGPDKGKVIQLVQTTVPQPDVFLGQQSLDLPANFKTNVSYSYWANTPIQKGWTAEFSAILITEQAHPLRRRARPVTDFGFSPSFTEAGGIQHGIRLGSCSTVAK
jgi:hypothetical protein